jgi:hypothetical protein
MSPRRVLPLIIGIAVVSTAPPARAATGRDWQVVRSPNVGGSVNSLADVAAISSADVWAVGVFFDPSRSANRTLIEHWDGTRWRVVDHPDVRTGYRSFTAVDASSATGVWAVGSFIRRRFGTEQSLITRWDGTRWTNVAAPARFGWDAIADISVVSADEAWAVGNEYTGSFVTRWHGTAWSVVPSPEAYFTAVHALAPDDVWVVGQQVESEGPIYVPLVLHWDGSAWTEIPSPSATADFTLLQSVYALSSEDVWAVGAAWDSTKPFHTHIQHWDGSSWTIVPGGPVGQDAELFDVHVVSPSEAWAVGRAQESTLIERWDGSAWQVEASPSPGEDHALLGISALATGELWAVGTVTRAGTPRTLTLLGAGQ